jgi:ankyrin repeat protein
LIQLPKRQLVIFSIYKKQVYGDVDISDFLKLQFHSDCMPRFCFLIQSGQWGLVREWMRFSTLFSDKLILDSFALGLYKLVPCDVLELLYDTHRIPATANENIPIQVFSSVGSVGKVLELLGDPMVDPSANSNTALVHACGYGHLDIVKLLLPRVNPAELSNQALQAASECGHIDIVRLLLQDGRVDVTDVNHWPLRLAVTNNHIELVSLFLTETISDPTALDNQCIRVACENGNAAMVKLLMSDARVNPTANNHESLMKACEKGHVEVVKALLCDPRVDPTARNHEAIRLCFEKGYPQIAILLVNDFRLHTIKSIGKSFKNLGF